MIVDSGNRLIFEGNGIATDFPFSFIVINASDIKVAISDNETGEVEELTKDYFVDTTASKVVYPGYSPGQEPADEAIPEVLPAGKKLIVYRAVPLTQENDLGNKYPFDTIEKGLDKNCILIQQIADAQSRSLTLPVSTPLGFATNLPTPVPGTSFRVNDAGTGYEVTVDPATVLPSVKNIKTEVEALKADTEEFKEQAETAASTAATTAAAEAASNAVSDVQDILDGIVTEVNTAKTTAVASASTATTKANEAQASAGTATTAAETASTAQVNASNYAAQAQAASSAAITAGNTATTKASEALASATSANTNANRAETAETTIAGYVASVESSVAQVNTATANAISAANSADSSASTATAAADIAASSKTAAAQSAAEAAQSAADAAEAAGGDFIPSAQKGAINGVATLDGNAQLNPNQIPAIPTSKITGTINLDNLPQGALERLVHVANINAMYQLTTAQVQDGDTVQLDDTQVMYRVVDDTKLNIAAGYKVFTAGLAASVPWAGVTGKPDFKAVATSGSYNDLSNKPDFNETVKSVNSVLPDDSGNVVITTFSIDDVYAVGDLYITTSSTNPATRWQGTTWELYSKGKTLVGATNFEGDSGDYEGTVYNAGDTGGEETHTLNENEMPSHTHSAWTDAQGNHGHALYGQVSGQQSGNTNGLFGGLHGSSWDDRTRTNGYVWNETWTANVPYVSVGGAHGHNVGIGATGGSGAHNNMQPYIVTYIWRRTA